jgi:PIN domain nuclease of toxin-antitoxin system
MAREYVLDAHALIWFVDGNPRLGVNARAALSDPNSVLFLPAIALAEVCWVVERGRCKVPSVATMLAKLDADPRITLVALDRPNLDRSFQLTALHEMHDRQIVATALHLIASGRSVSLLTADGNITASGLVPIIW